MKQRTLFLFACGIITGQPTQAQTPASAATSKQTAFAMTRATVEFLATDIKKFGYNKTPCQPCSTYSDLNQFVKQNHLLGADGLITDIQKQSATSSPSELQTFLLDRVSKGSRSYRQKLPSFPSYQQKLVALAKGLLDTSDSDGSNLNDQAVAIPDDSVATEESGSTHPDETGQSESAANSQPQSSMLPLISIIFSILSLAGVVILWFRKQPSSNISLVSPDAQLSDLKTKMDRLEGSNSQLRKQLDDLKKKFDKQGSNTIIQPQATPATPPSSPDLPVISPPKIESVPASPPANTLRTPQPAMPTLFYGRTADLGDGFSVSGLSTKLDRDTVFEIRRIDNARAEFQVSDNPDLQRLALSDPYSYLNDTCSYATQPRPGSRIQTERPGTLSLQGEKWAITEKAQVSFQ